MKTNAILSLALVLTLSLTTGCQLFQNGPADPDCWTANIAGDYKGTIFTGTIEYPGTTTFAFEDGALVGTYELDDKGKTVTGTLTDIKKAGERQLTCIWNDQDRKGPFTLTFSEDFSSFEGQWANEGEEPKHGWNGKK